MFGHMAQRALRCSFTSFFFAMNFLFTHHRCELYSDSHHYLLFTCKSSILCVCVPWIVSCCIAFPTSCSRACVEWGWMINVYKSQFSLQWKIPHTLMLPLCWKKNPSQLLLLLVLSESCVRFSLKTFQAKKPPSSALRPHVLLLLLDCERRRREECSYSSHSHLVCLLSSLCCVAHDELFPICCILPWVEWHLFCCFKNWWRVHVINTSAPDQGYQQPCWYCMLT